MRDSYVDHIRIDVRGKYDGDSVAVFDLAEWRAMAPITRVLRIHRQCRDTLRGQPFDVLSERILRTKAE